MIDVLLALDTEDYVTPEAWDAQKWWADELAGRGLRGSFQCVAQVIRTLKARGRQDVIDSLSRHEIGYHTDLHSIAPTHAPGVAKLSLEQGIAWVLRREAVGFAELVRTFGRVPISYCAPGDVWTAATLLAMAKMGVKVFTGSRLHCAPGQMEWYAGLLMVAYDAELCFDNVHGDADGERKFLQSLEAAVNRCGDHGVVCLWTHPTMLATTAFWDVPRNGNAAVSVDKLPPAPLRPPAQVQAAKDRVRQILDTLQRRCDLRFTNLASLYGRCSRQRRDLDALLTEAGLRPGDEGQLARDDPAGNDWPIRCPTGWPILPKDLDTANLNRQAELLRWTWSAVSLSIA